MISCGFRQMALIEYLVVSSKYRSKCCPINPLAPTMAIVIASVEFFGSITIFAVYHGTTMSIRL